VQRLLAKHRFADIDRALRFLAIRLGSRPETSALANDVTQARTAARESEDKYQQALQARVAGSAEIEYLDGRLDELVMTVARDLLAATRGNRADPRYLKLFATAPSVAMSPLGGDAQDLYVRNIVTRLREDKELAPVQQHAEELSTRRAALEAATEKRRGLAVAEASTDADRRIALDNARRIYNRTEAQLQLAFGDKALVESYFVTLSARAKGEESEGEG
jgi:hypothetical protein